MKGDYIERLSRWFERAAAVSYDHRWWVLAGCALLLAASAWLSASTRVDNSFEAYFDRGDPFYQAYLRFREDFGSDEVSYIVYEAPGRPYGIWNLDVMRKIAQLSERIENEVPFVKEVTSLANVEFLDPVPDGLAVIRLIEDFPSSQAELLEYRDKLLDKPLYVGGLVSPDGTYGAIVVEMEKSSVDPPEEIRVDPSRGNAIDNLYPQATYDAIERLLADPRYEGIVFYHTGDVPLNAVVNRITSNESKRLGVACFVVVGFLLAVFIRRPIGVVGPLAVVACSVLVTIGFVGLLGWNLDQMFGMMPALLIAVGVADSVHIISEFRVFHAELGDRREAIRRTLYLVGTPCLLTSLTTAAGFAAMSFAPIKAIAHFGAYSAAGVMAAFVLTLTLLVAFLGLGRRRREALAETEVIRAKGGRAFQAALEGIARFDIRHRRAILAVLVTVVAIALAGATRLKVESNFLNEFGPSVPIRDTTAFVDRVMGGTLTFSYLIETGREGGVKDPAVLGEVERLQAEALRHGGIVRKTYSLVDFIKDINRTFHEGDRRYYVLPESRDLVAQYLLLYEMSGGEEAEEYVSTDYSRTRLEIRTTMASSTEMRRLVEHLQAYLARAPFNASEAHLTGMGALWLKLMDYITRSQIIGFLLAFVAIAAMMCLLFRSLRTGLLSMVPNLAPVILTLGGMGWTGVPLDYVRLLIAPVAIGIAVDDTIHHVTRMRHEFHRSGSYEQAILASMTDVGRALFLTSAVLVAGFLVFVLSEMDSQVSFGLLLASTIILALIADFFVMPALVLTFEPFGPEGMRRITEDRNGERRAA